MSLLENGSLVKQKAAGSTSKGAFPSMSICSMALTKPNDKADPFVLFHQLILLESHRKSKQTPPKPDRLFQISSLFWWKVAYFGGKLLKVQTNRCLLPVSC
jgi:hypothetical protein